MFKFQIDSEIQHAVPSVLKALDASSIAFFIKNDKLEYIHANAAYCNLLEYKNIQELTDFDLFLADIATEQGLIDQQLLTSEMPSTTESVIIGKNRVERVLEINRSIYKEHNQTYIVGVVQDITDKKQKEQFSAYKQVLTSDELSEQIINRFSSYIFNNNEEQVILDGVGKLCIDLLKLEDISIFLYNEESKQLEQRTFIGKDRKLVYEKHRPVTLELGQGIIGNAALQRSTLIIDDISQDDRHIQGIVDARSELSIPIIYKTKLIGVLDSENSLPDYFKKSHITLLEGIAGLLAIKLNEVKNYRELKAKKKQLEAFIAHSPVSVVMLDTEFNYLAVSECWRKMYGIEEHIDLIGKSHFDLNPNLPIRWKKMITQAMGGDIVQMDKEYYQRKNGNREWYSAKLTPWYQNDKTIGGVIINAEIITDVVVREHDYLNVNQELKEARKLGKLFSWEFDPDSGTTSWSNGNVFGLNEAELATTSIVDIVEEGYKEDFNKAVYAAIENKSSFQLIHPIKVGSRKFWVHTRGQIQLKGEHIVSMRGTAQDITEQIMTQESLQIKNEELQKVNEELDQFVYKTAHDLRAPLTNLIGLIGVMRNEKDFDLLSTYFDLQQKSVERMDAFIHKIANFTKNTRLPVISTEVNLPQLLDEILNDFNYYDKSAQIEKMVDFQISTDLYSDKERLKTILSNLVSNAIKFADLSDVNPFLRISVAADSKLIEFTIEDNGLGMTPAVAERAFEMFYRGHTTADGTGVGLYIAQEAVKKLNGKISLNSTEHKGTTVFVSIPNLAADSTE